MQSDTDSNTSSLMELMAIKPREFTFGPGPGISSGKVEFNILAPGNTCDAYLYLDTQYGATTSYAKKTAIVAEGQDTDGKAKLHFCLNNDSGNGNVSTSANYTNDSIMTLIPSGNVGIGTTNPTRELEVNGRILAKTSLLIGDSTDTASDRLISALDSDMTGSRYIIFGKENADANQAELSFYYDRDNSTSNRLSLGLNSSPTILNILRNGNVGIGITNPNSTFEIVGYTSKEDSSYYWQTGNAFSSGNGYVQMRIKSASDSGSHLNLGVDTTFDPDRCIIQGQDDFTGGLSLWLNPVGGSVIMGSGSTAVTSDDRLKENEQYITNAIDTLLKLKPQFYDKKNTIDNTDTSSWFTESGLITQ